MDTLANTKGESMKEKKEKNCCHHGRCIECLRALRDKVLKKRCACGVALPSVARYRCPACAYAKGLVR